MFLIECLEGTDWITACQSIVCLPTEVATITSFIYNAIRIVAPLVLVIVGMFEMTKAITAGKEDEIKKAQQLLVKRALAAAIIFLLFSFITWMLNILSSNGTDTQNVLNCLNVLFGENGDHATTDAEKECLNKGYDGIIKFRGRYDSNFNNYVGNDTIYFCYKNISEDECGNKVESLHTLHSETSWRSIKTSGGASLCVLDKINLSSGITVYNVPVDYIYINSCGKSNSKEECSQCCKDKNQKYIFQDATYSSGLKVDPVCACVD